MILISSLRWALTAVPFILLLSERKFRTAFIYAGVYTVAYISQTLLMSIAYGAVNFLFVALGIAARFMPGIAMASYMVGTTTVSEFMASMERMHIPQKITIPMSVMFRFFPRSARNTAASPMPCECAEYASAHGILSRSCCAPLHSRQ